MRSVSRSGRLIAQYWLGYPKQLRAAEKSPEAASQQRPPFHAICTQRIRNHALRRLCGNLLLFLFFPSALQYCLSCKLSSCEVAPHCRACSTTCTANWFPREFLQQLPTNHGHLLRRHPKGRSHYAPKDTKHIQMCVESLCKLADCNCLARCVCLLQRPLLLHAAGKQHSDASAPTNCALTRLPVCRWLPPIPP